MKTWWMVASLGGVLIGFSPAPVSEAARTFGFGGSEEAQDSSMGRNALGEAIAKGLTMLRGKKYAEFLKTFIQPDELKEMMEDESLEAVVAEFAREASQILEVFEKLRDLKPALDEAGTLATFTLPGKGVRGQKEFKFLRIGERWYVED